MKKTLKKGVCVYNIDTNCLHDATCGDVLLIGTKIGGPKIIFKDINQATNYLGKKIKTKHCSNYTICESCRTTLTASPGH